MSTTPENCSICTLLCTYVPVLAKEIQCFGCRRLFKPLETHWAPLHHPETASTQTERSVSVEMAAQTEPGPLKLDVHVQAVPEPMPTPPPQFQPSLPIVKQTPLSFPLTFPNNNHQPCETLTDSEEPDQLELVSLEDDDEPHGALTIDEHADITDIDFFMPAFPPLQSSVFDGSNDLGSPLKKRKRGRPRIKPVKEPPNPNERKKRRPSERVHFLSHCGGCDCKFKEMNISVVQCDNCLKWYCDRCVPIGTYALNKPYLCSQCVAQEVSLLAIPDVRPNTVADGNTVIVQCPNDWCTHFVDVSMPEFTEEEAQRMHYAMRRHADTCRKKYKTGFRLIHNPGRKPNKYVPIEKWGLPFDTPIVFVKTEYDDELHLLYTKNETY